MASAPRWWGWPEAWRAEISTRDGYGLEGSCSVGLEAPRYGYRVFWALCVKPQGLVLSELCLLVPHQLHSGAEGSCGRLRRMRYPVVALAVQGDGSLAFQDQFGVWLSSSAPVPSFVARRVRLCHAVHGLPAAGHHLEVLAGCEGRGVADKRPRGFERSNSLYPKETSMSRICRFEEQCLVVGTLRRDVDPLDPASNLDAEVLLYSWAAMARFGP